MEQPGKIAGVLAAATALGVASYQLYKKQNQAVLKKEAKLEVKIPKGAEIKLKRERVASLDSLAIDEKDFVSLLGELIGLAEQLQNNPPKFVPRETLAADVVLKFLKKYIDEGTLKAKKVEYVPGRANLIIEYPTAVHTDKVMSFVGSHMDVVPANAADWSRNPFQLTVEGDKLYGRGVTDCLGHVATMACFFKQLAELKPVLKTRVVAVLIANEEAASEVGCGIDELAKNGELDFLKSGPLYWTDSANFGPTIGTGGIVCWSLTAIGKNFHSGLPNKAINPISLASLALQYVERRFYEDFAFSQKERDYLFEVGSSFKATQISSPPGSLNIIPQSCTISGDVRITPFYSVEEVKKKIEQYVSEFDVTSLKPIGDAPFVLPDEDLKGRIELRWLGEGMEGVACKLSSPGYSAICEALTTVVGKCNPFSLTGSLPIIRSLVDMGYDVQITGFGRLEAYHAINEFGLLSEFLKGGQVMARIVSTLDAMEE